MIGGRLNAMMLASRILAPSANTLRISACAESDGALGRSANGFSLTTMKPTLLSFAESSSEKPDDREGLVDLRERLHQRSRPCFTTALVRDTDAPSGNWIDMKKAPWSSSGRKPVGVIELDR